MASYRLRYETSLVVVVNHPHPPIRYLQIFALIISISVYFTIVQHYLKISSIIEMIAQTPLAQSSEPILLVI